jgi:uncharacterized protein
MEENMIKYLIDVGHPAHVHYFKNIAKGLEARGKNVLFTCRDKDVTLSLLEKYTLRYINLGRNYRSIVGKIFSLIYFTIRLYVISIKYKPDIYLNASIYSAFVAWLFRKPHISIEDTFNKEQVNLYLPFTSCILTGDYEHPNLGDKEIRYNGYQELLYLHPKYFNQDYKILEELGLNDETPYVIVRFVAWNASHDRGHKGISDKNKLELVRTFSKYAKVFISSEILLPPHLEEYRIPVSPHRLHDAIAFSSLIYGESATMVSEAAILGVPGIFVHNNTIYYTKDQENKYGLVFNFSESEEDQIKSICKGVEILTKNNLRKDWQTKRLKMMQEKIDVTAFMLWFVENYPESSKIMKENPDYQYNFR